MAYVGLWLYHKTISTAPSTTYGTTAATPATPG